MLIFSFRPLGIAFLLISLIASTVSLLLLLAYYLLCRDFEHESDKPKRYPLVSVIIPAYNEGEAIKASIESVLNQDYPKEKVQLIVVDDGSTDNTYEVASRYKTRGVLVIRKKNGGAADAKNVGLRHAKGEIVVTMDSDTVMRPDVLRKIVWKIEQGADAVTTGIRVRNKENFVEWMQHLEYDNTIFLRRVLAFLDAIFVTPGGCSAYRREILERCGGFDARSLTEDQEIAFHIQKLGGRIDALLTAFVYTEVPSTLSALFRQRVRWLKGGFYNKLKYLELLSPRYGDFVFFAFFFDVFFVMSFAVTLWALWDLLTHLSNPLLFVSRVGLWNLLLFSPDPFFFSTCLLLPLALWWFGKTVNMIRKHEGEPTLSLKEYAFLPFYFFFFSTLYFTAQLVALWEFLRGDYFRWDTR